MRDNTDNEKDQKMKVKDDLLLQVLDEDTKKPQGLKDREVDIVNFTTALIKDWSWRRQDMEYLWKSCWAHYFNTPQSANYLRAEALQLGQSNDEGDWRHRIHTGKGYDLVETVNSYLQQAFFPNNDWFDLEPATPMDDDGWKDKLNRVKALMRKKLNEAYFEDWWDIYCRQICVVGTSVLAMPWRYDVQPVKKNVRIRQASGDFKLEVIEVPKVIKNGLDIEVVDMFDFFLDPDANFSTYINGGCCRRIRKRKSEIISLIRSGIYFLGEEERVLSASSTNLLDYDSDQDRQDIKGMLGLEYWKDQASLNDTVELWEYWGDVYLEDIEYKDVVVTLLNDHLLCVEQNPFWDGKPFIVGTYLNTQGSPYGVGLLQPVVGQLHQMFILQNHRLDVSEITINPMYQVVNDGILDLENLFSYPGKILEVDTIGNIAPIPIEKDNSISVQDEGLLEQRIDKTTGVGAYLGVNAGRDAERVTAEEVKAQRNAGGNRLNRIFGHIESTSLTGFLHKMYTHMQQFITEDETVKVSSPEYGIAYDFWAVGVEEMYDDYDVYPLGSAHVADKEFELKNATDFVAIMSSNPELAMRVNWDEMSAYLSRKFLREKWERFVKEGEQAPPAMPPEQAAPPPPSPEEQMMMQQQAQQQALPDEAYAAAGEPGKNMMTELQSNPEQYQQFLNNTRKDIYARK